jgi:hypothetical protein
MKAPAKQKIATKLLTDTLVFAVSERFARVLASFPDDDPQQALFRMIRIHDVLIRIRIHG